jgi:hypothetical protein
LFEDNTVISERYVWHKIDGKNLTHWNNPITRALSIASSSTTAAAWRCTESRRRRRYYRLKIFRTTNICRP